jgi:hypothetical protein
MIHAGLVSMALAAANAGAGVVGETIDQVLARYGKPEDDVTLVLGFGLWKTEQGEIDVSFQDGKAVIVSYSGGVDEKEKETLLGSNLPAGQSWVDGKDLKAFMVAFAHQRQASDPVSEEMLKGEYRQTGDGKLWAWYSPEDKYFGIATAEGFKRSLGEAGALQGAGH